MSDEKILTPEEQFNKILGEAAQKIKQMEDSRDKPQTNSPKPEYKMDGGPKSSTRNSDLNKQGNDNFYNDNIANLKAETIKQTDQVIGKMPAYVQKEMKAKVLGTMYPAGKGDLNQIPHPDKVIDNAQERYNSLFAQNNQKNSKAEAAKQHDQQDTKQAKEQPNATRFSQNLSHNQQQQKDKLNEQIKDVKGKTQGKEEKTEDKEQNSKPMGSMTTRFSQNLSHHMQQQKSDQSKGQENVGQQSAEKNSGKPDPMGSMSTRFSQTLSHYKADSADKGVQKSKGKDIAD